MSKTSIKTTKTSIKTQIVYGMGQAGDTIPFILFYSFFLYYLTDTAGVAPIIAGAISTIAIIWDGITDPIVGYLSDNCNSKYGKRRVFMGATIIPYVIVIALLFFPIEGSELFKNIYYIVVGVAFWTCYTTWGVPYLSLVTDITKDYNDRNDIRMFNMIFGGSFMLLCLSGPMLVLEKCMEMGYSERIGWGISGAIFAAFTGICMLVCWIGMRGKEKIYINEGNVQEEKESIFKVIKETFQIKAYRQICFMTMVLVLGITLTEAAGMYLYTSNLNFSEGKIAEYYLIYSIMYVVATPIVSKLANIIGKNKVFIWSCVVCAMGNIIFWQIGITTYARLIVDTVFIIFNSVIFWMMYVTFTYDVAEISAYKYRKRRDGSIVSIIGIAQKTGAAIGTFVLGALLTLINYDGMAEVHPPEVLDGINMLNTLPLAIAAIISILLMFRYPVTKKRYEALTNALEAIETSGDYDEEEFKELLK